MVFFNISANTLSGNVRLGSGKLHFKQTGKQHIWNSVETDRQWLNVGIGKFFDIIMSIVQYFVVLGKSNFLHFRSISNKLKKVVLIRVEMCIKSSIFQFSTDLSHLIDQ
ncbi:hypothetical protein T09_15646 [Trichinella sp. T9]|nr:hypothetical protein T09_15646 [Trichinella sp. T9]